MVNTALDVHIETRDGRVSLIGIGEAYLGNTKRIRKLIARDTTLRSSIHSVTAHGRDIVVTLERGYDWTDDLVAKVSALFA